MDSVISGIRGDFGVPAFGISAAIESSTGRPVVYGPGGVVWTEASTVALLSPPGHDRPLDWCDRPSTCLVILPERMNAPRSGT
jgi:hypothetical protein